MTPPKSAGGSSRSSARECPLALIAVSCLVSKEFRAGNAGLRVSIERLGAGGAGGETLRVGEGGTERSWTFGGIDRLNP